MSLSAALFCKKCRLLWSRNYLNIPQRSRRKFHDTEDLSSQIVSQLLEAITGDIKAVIYKHYDTMFSASIIE